VVRVCEWKESRTSKAVMVELDGVREELGRWRRLRDREEEEVGV